MSDQAAITSTTLPEPPWNRHDVLGDHPPSVLTAKLKVFYGHMGKGVALAPNTNSR